MSLSAGVSVEKPTGTLTISALLLASPAGNACSLISDAALLSYLTAHPTPPHYMEAQLQHGKRQRTSAIDIPVDKSFPIFPLSLLQLPGKELRLHIF